MKYPDLDIILDGLERGLTDKQIFKTGVSKKQIYRVRQMVQNSEWKRK
jgi:hypothetical protein